MVSLFKPSDVSDSTVELSGQQLRLLLEADTSGNWPFSNSVKHGTTQGTRDEVEEHINNKM